MLKGWAQSEQPPYKRLARLESLYFRLRHQASQERSELERWRLAREPPDYS